MAKPLELGRLDPCPGQPLAIAFSGGGDSMALVHMMRDRLPMPLILIVDHGLRPGSETEANQAANFAESLGFETRVLTWRHNSPATGIQEKARRARYSLIGDVCRSENITHLLTGHTQDDQAETLLMRRDRGTDWRGAAGIKDRVYSPLWPELAGITLHRPLMDISRVALRVYNRKNGLQWAEDPSNQDAKYARIRARRALLETSNLRAQLLEEAHHLQPRREQERRAHFQFIQERVDIDSNGFIHAPEDVPVRLLAGLLRAASGTGGPIPSKKLEQLKAALEQSDFKAATLVNAHIKKMAQGFVIGPDPATITGRAGRLPMTSVIWPARQRKLWAGRFWIETAQDGMTVKPLLGNIANLPAPIWEKLRGVPAPFRSALPFVSDANGDLAAVGTLCAHPDVQISSAVAPRLHGMLSAAEYLRHNM